MTLTVVSNAIGALMLGIFIGRRIVMPPSEDGATVPELVQRILLCSHHGVVLLDGSGKVVLADPAGTDRESARSRPGTGSTFTLRIPAHPDTRDRQSAPCCTMGFSSDLR